MEQQVPTADQATDTNAQPSEADILAQFENMSEGDALDALTDIVNLQQAATTDSDETPTVDEAVNDEQPAETTEQADTNLDVDPLFADEEQEDADSNLDIPTTAEGVNIFKMFDEDPDKVWMIPDKNAEGGFKRITGRQAKSMIGSTASLHDQRQKLNEDEAAIEERRNDLSVMAAAFELSVEPRLTVGYEECC